MWFHQFNAMSELGLVVFAKGTIALLFYFLPIYSNYFLHTFYHLQVGKKSAVKRHVNILHKLSI